MENEFRFLSRGKYIEINYEPKFYDCILDGIRTDGNKHLFHLTEKTRE